MTYSLHPAAEQDIADALDFYTGQAGSVVARRFLMEFERVAQLLIKHPGFGTPTTRGRKIFPLQVFPYSVVYQNVEAVSRSWLFGISIGSPALAATGGDTTNLVRPHRRAQVSGDMYLYRLQARARRPVPPRGVESEPRGTGVCQFAPAL